MIFYPKKKKDRISPIKWVFKGKQTLKCQKIENSTNIKLCERGMLWKTTWKKESWKLRVYLVGVFKNCFGKEFLRIVFKNGFLYFQKQNLVWKLNFKK